MSEWRKFIRKRMRHWNKTDCLDRYGFYFYWRTHLERASNK